jgi:hypothetical protein
MQEKPMAHVDETRGPTVRVARHRNLEEWSIADFREQPARKIAATLREWAALLNQAAASLE